VNRAYSAACLVYEWFLGRVPQAYDESAPLALGSSANYSVFTANLFFRACASGIGLPRQHLDGRRAGAIADH
jgi:hypothetical protein